MLTILTIINVLVFLLLAALHFYWAFGGNARKDIAIPTAKNGRQLFRPSIAITICVATGLLFFAVIDLGHRHWLQLYADSKHLKYSVLLIGIIFLTRAIGDFRYIGFFKVHQASRFAKNDNMIYSPLCLFLALTHAITFMAD